MAQRWNIPQRTQPSAFSVLLGAALFLAALVAAPQAFADGQAVSEASAAEEQPVGSMLLRYREGEHYQRVPKVVPRQGDAVEVTEYFSFSCVHCFNFEPFVNAWASKLGADVRFKRVPAVFNRSWEFLARAYYTAEVLGVEEEMHQPLFDAIHRDNINIGKPALMAKLFKDHGGIEADEFFQAFDSFSVRSRVQQAKAQGRALGLRAVPSMVVDGQYVVEGGVLAGGNEEMLVVVDYLVAMIQAEMDSERHLIEAATGD